MEQELRPSCIEDSVLPVKIVTLEDWKLQDGTPMQVGCGAVDIVDVAVKIGALPGARPEIADRRPQTVKLESVLQTTRSAIEVGTFLIDRDGNQIRPAFTWHPEQHPRSLAGTYLSQRDRERLASCVLGLSGFTQGSEGSSEDGSSFRDGAAAPDGDRAVAVLPGAGDHAEAGASGS